MRFKESRTISNVDSYDIQDGIIYLSKGDRLKRAIFYKMECLYQENVCSFVKKLEDIVVFYTWDLKVYKKDSTGLKLLLEGYSIAEEAYDNKKIVLAKENNIGSQIFLYDIENEIFIQELEAIPYLVTDDREFYIFNQIIKQRSVLNSHDWEIDLSGRKYINDLREEKDVKIVKLLGVESGQLIVFMSSKELILIDVETGSILWETNDFIKNNLPEYKDHRMVSSIFHYCILENDKLYQLDGNIYYSLDLKTQEVEILWEDKSENEYITCKRKTYTEDYVYFTGSRGGRFSSYLLGAFNRKTLQMDWVHKPKGIVNPLTNAPQYVDGKLYILDSGGILHIYERE